MGRERAAGGRPGPLASGPGRSRRGPEGTPRGYRGHGSSVAEDEDGITYRHGHEYLAHPLGQAVDAGPKIDRGDRHPHPQVRRQGDHAPVSHKLSSTLVAVLLNTRRA